MKSARRFHDDATHKREKVTKEKELKSNNE
jgi:hypothetical protein